MIQDKTINEDFETYKKELLTIVNATVKKENLSLLPHHPPKKMLRRYMVLRCCEKYGYEW